MPRYVSEDALERLDEYKYSGIDKSVLSKYVLNPYWNRLVKLWPKSVAPNTITLTGLCLVFLNFFTMIMFDPQYRTSKEGVSGPPQWIYYTWGIGLFLYQSLDAIDGKQARRTGMAGPLGEMFDHGCDAINTTLECILAAYALNLGRSRWTVASFVLSTANFYLTTWEEFHTGQLFLGVFSGPVEGILMICVIYVISGAYGTRVWDTNIWNLAQISSFSPALEKVLPPLALNEAFMVIGAIGLAFNIVTSIKNVYHASPSLVDPLLRLLPFLVSSSLHLLCLASPSISHSELIHSSLFVPFLLAWGASFAHQVGRMILAHLTRRNKMPWFDPSWILLGTVSLYLHLERLISLLPAPLALLLPSFAPLDRSETRKTQSLAESSSPSGYLTAFVVTYFIISVGFYARFVALVISDITNYLGIACFTVRKRGRDGVWRAAVVPPSPDSVENDKKKLQ